jgi:K+-sensing histidine kinase KdpD
MIGDAKQPQNLMTNALDALGMGLSICRSIVEASSGHVWATPNNPAGPVFEFILHADTAAAGLGTHQVHAGPVV